MFHCDKCGLCCMSVGQNPIYRHLDRGDGICLYLDTETRLCTIYASRPLLCNVDAAYEQLYRDSMSREEFYQLNYDACRQLKENYHRG